MALVLLSTDVCDINDMFVQLSLQMEHLSSFVAWRYPIAMAMDGLSFDRGGDEGLVHSVFFVLPLLLFLLVEVSGSDAKIEGRSPFLEVRLRLKRM